MPAGTVCDETISIVDTLASVAAITGAALPKASEGAEDSHDVSKAWLGSQYEGTLRPDVIVHSADGNFAIRKGSYKWIEGVPADDVRPAAKKAHAAQSKPQLFDLKNDIAEEKEISANPADVVNDLIALLNRYRDGGYSRELPPTGVKPKPTFAELPPLANAEPVDVSKFKGAAWTARDEAMFAKAIGVRKVLEVAEMAKAKKLNVVVGLQRHYQKVYTDTMKMVHGGKVGDILSAQVYWNNDGVWVRPRKSGMTEMEYQMRNWYYFNWLCGDHIVEQHIHNLDVINWAKQAYPVQAQGLGGRQVRTGNEFGEIYDHHYVEYIYADGTVMNSQCRHIKNTWSRVAETMIGTKGKVSFEKGTITTHSGKVLYKHEGKNDPNPYQVEHDMLFDAIAKGEYKYADTEFGAKSTMTAILGRMATYSGKLITWVDALKSNINLQPDAYTWTTRPKVYPDSDGHYPIAMPGESIVV